MNYQLFKEFERSSSLSDVTGNLSDKIRNLVDEMIFKRMDLSCKKRYGIYSIFADFDDNVKSGKYTSLTDKELTLMEMTMHVICKQLHKLDIKEDFQLRSETMLQNLKDQVISNLENIKPGKERVVNNELIPFINNTKIPVPAGIVVARIMSALIMEDIFKTDNLLKNIQTLSVAGIRSFGFIDQIYLADMKNNVHIKDEQFKSAMAIAFQFHVLYEIFNKKMDKSVPKELETLKKLFEEIYSQLQTTFSDYDFMVQYFKKYMENDMKTMSDKNKFNQDDFE